MQPQPTNARNGRLRDASRSAKPSRLRQAVRILLPLASILLLIALLWFSDLPALLTALSTASLPLLLAAAALELLSLALRVLRWQRFIRPLAPITLSQAAASYFPALFLSNFTPGRVGEPIRALFLKRQLTKGTADSGRQTGTGRAERSEKAASKEFSAVTALPAIIMERAFDVLVLVLLSLLALSALSSDLVLLNTILLVIIVLAALLVFKKPALLTRLLRVARIAKGDGITAKLEAGARMPVLTLVVGFLITLVIWTLEGLAFWLSFAALGISLGPAAISLFALSVLIGLITLLPGGIGSTELSLAALAAKATAAPLSAATAAALVGRLATFWLAMLVSAAWWRKVR